MRDVWPPEELDTQVADKQGSVEFQLFTSLLRFRSGWFANKSLQRTRHVAVVCNLRDPCAGSLSLVR